MSTARRRLELFEDGPKADLLGPSGFRLFETGDDGGLYGMGRMDHRVSDAIRLPSTQTWRIDLAIADDVHDVNSLDCSVNALAVSHIRWHNQRPAPLPRMLATTGSLDSV